MQVNTSLKYYIAGPMSGLEHFNYPAFAAAEVQLKGMGLDVVSPRTAPWPADHEEMDSKDLWRAMIRATMKMLLDCEGIILLKGWSKSNGANLELTVAKRLEMPSLFYLETTQLAPLLVPFDEERHL